MMSQRVGALGPFSILITFRICERPVKTPAYVIYTKVFLCPLSQSSEGKAMHSGSKGLWATSSIRQRDLSPQWDVSTTKTEIYPHSFFPRDSLSKAQMWRLWAFTSKPNCVQPLNQLCYCPSILECSSEKQNKIT